MATTQARWNDGTGKQAAYVATNYFNGSGTHYHDCIQYVNNSDKPQRITNFSFRGGIAEKGDEYNNGDSVVGTGVATQIEYSVRINDNASIFSGKTEEINVLITGVGTTAEDKTYPIISSILGQDVIGDFSTSNIVLQPKDTIKISFSGLTTNTVLVLYTNGYSTPGYPYVNVEDACSKPGAPTIHNVSQSGNKINISFTVGTDGTTNPATGVKYWYYYGSAGLSGSSIPENYWYTGAEIAGSAGTIVNHSLTATSDMDTKTLYIQAWTKGTEGVGEAFLWSDTTFKDEALSPIYFYEKPSPPLLAIWDNGNDTFSATLSTKNTKYETVLTTYEIYSNGKYIPNILHGSTSGTQNNLYIVDHDNFDPQDHETIFTIAAQSTTTYGGSSKQSIASARMFYHVLLDYYDGTIWHKECYVYILNNNKWKEGLRLQRVSTTESQAAWINTQKTRK